MSDGGPVRSVDCSSCAIGDLGMWPCGEIPDFIHGGYPGRDEVAANPPANGDVPRISLDKPDSVMADPVGAAAADVAFGIAFAGRVLVGCMAKDSDSHGQFGCKPCGSGERSPRGDRAIRPYLVPN